MDAIWTLSHAMITICSTSTFCFWAALVNSGSAYFPISKLILNGNISFIKSHILQNRNYNATNNAKQTFHFIIQPSVSFFYYDPFNTTSILRSLWTKPDNVSVI